MCAETFWRSKCTAEVWEFANSKQKNKNGKKLKKLFLENRRRIETHCLKNKKMPTCSALGADEQLLI